MRNIWRGLDCPFHVGLLPIGRFYNGARPVISQLRATNSFHFATHVAAILSLTGSANGRNRRSCILAAAVYHSSVYCTASAYCSPRAPVYYGSCNHWTKHYDANILETCILWCRPTDWTKHIEVPITWCVKIGVPQTDKDQPVLWKHKRIRGLVKSGRCRKSRMRMEIRVDRSQSFSISSWLD